jgi:hypothetical protein
MLMVQLSFFLLFPLWLCKFVDLILNLLFPQAHWIFQIEPHATRFLHARKRSKQYNNKSHRHPKKNTSIFSPFFQLVQQYLAILRFTTFSQCIYFFRLVLPIDEGMRHSGVAAFNFVHLSISQIEDLIINKEAIAKVG